MRIERVIRCPACGEQRPEGTLRDWHFVAGVPICNECYADLAENLTYDDFEERAPAIKTSAHTLAMATKYLNRPLERRL